MRRMRYFGYVGFVETNGHETIAIVGTSRGKSILNPDDIDDRNRGARIAMCRAIARENRKLASKYGKAFATALSKSADMTLHAEKLAKSAKPRINALPVQPASKAGRV